MSGSLSPGPLVIPLSRLDTYTISVSLAFLADAAVSVAASVVRPDGSLFEHAVRQDIKRKNGTTVRLTILITTNQLAK